VLGILVQNPLLRRQMAAKAEERVREQYLWPAIARAIEKSYYEVLGWEVHSHPARTTDASTDRRESVSRTGVAAPGPAA
jgi:hypothetical protein